MLACTSSVACPTSSGLRYPNVTFGSCAVSARRSSLRSARRRQNDAVQCSARSERSREYLSRRPLAQTYARRQCHRERRNQAPSRRTGTDEPGPRGGVEAPARVDTRYDPRKRRVRMVLCDPRFRLLSPGAGASPRTLEGRVGIAASLSMNGAIVSTTSADSWSGVRQPRGACPSTKSPAGLTLAACFPVQMPLLEPMLTSRVAET